MRDARAAAKVAWLSSGRGRPEETYYRCTAATPCEGRALHHRGDRGACGVSAQANGHLLCWTECPGQESTAIGEVTVESLTTRQVAERRHVPVSMVVRPLASG